MKVSLITLIITLSLITVPLSESVARPQKHHAKRYFRPPLPNSPRQLRYPRLDGWYPHEANELPFGSAIWWDQMRREGRAGQGRGG